MNTGAIRQSHRTGDFAHEMSHTGGCVSATLILAAAMLLPGCNSVSGPLATLPSPFGRSAIKGSLRKQADADPFPTAQQAGVGKRVTSKDAADE